MIYITGDTHGDRFRFIKNTLDDENWTKDDFLIVCGDFGYIFLNDSAEEKFLDYLEAKPYTICFCDGNHENFPAIFSYPEITWKGGKVHKIRKNIFHLMRGQFFTIENKKIFTMGGAYSIDRYMRKLNYSYWNEELPSNEEYSEAIENLKKHKKADIVISHTAPREIVQKMGFSPDIHDMELTGFLEWVMHEIEFSHWYFGHWHTDETFYGKFTAVYFSVHKIE